MSSEIRTPTFGLPGDLRGCEFWLRRCEYGLAWPLSNCNCILPTNLPRVVFRIILVGVNSLNWDTVDHNSVLEPSYFDTVVRFRPVYS
jgi:hypothetical protein